MNSHMSSTPCIYKSEQLLCTNQSSLKYILSFDFRCGMTMVLGKTKEGSKKFSLIFSFLFDYDVLNSFLWHQADATLA